MQFIKTSIGTKPFVFETLLDILRNTQLSPAPNRGLIIYDDITLKPNDRMLCSKNRKCTLSKWETQLLELFLSSPGVPLSYNYVPYGTLTTIRHIKSLNAISDY